MKWIVLGWFALGGLVWYVTWKVVPMAVVFALGWTGLTVSLTPTILIVWAIRSLRGKKS